MSKNIVVAGLGHGGIVAAALLSEKGYNVTVYEKGIMYTSGIVCYSDGCNVGKLVCITNNEV